MDRVRGAVVLMVALGVVPPAAAAQTGTVYTGATVRDGVSTTPLTDARLVVRAGRITCVSGPDGCPTAAEEREVSLDGLWVIPGLIDTHVHLTLGSAPDEAMELQRLRFALGITTVRDAGSGAVESALRVREDGRGGDRPIPRLVVTAVPSTANAERFGTTPGPATVRHLAELGVDAIKLMDPEGAWVEDVRAARAAGLPVYGHTWNGPPPVVVTDEAIDAGVEGLSHLWAISPVAQPPGTVLDAPSSVRAFWPWRKALWTTAVPDSLDAIAARLAARDVWIEPFLVAEYHWFRDVPTPPSLDSLRSSAPGLRSWLRGGATERWPEPTYPDSYSAMRAFVAEFHERGGRLVVGSDDAGLAVGIHEEIRLLSDAGLGPAEALRAATGDAALAIGREDVGAVAEGRLADFLVYERDPLAEPWGTLRPRTVVKGGVEHDADQLLAEVAAIAESRRRAGLWRLIPVGATAAVVLVAIGWMWLRRRRTAGP